MNIVFAGTPPFALPSLQALFHSRHQLMAVYTQPDRPAGRGQQVHASPVKSWAVDHQIPVHQPLNFKSQETRDALASLKPDILVVIAYGLILPTAVLTIPRYGSVNVHASLLPRWRGASPIQHAILKGDAKSGITLMQMDAGMDTGAMLSTIDCVIHPHDTAESLHDALSQLAPEPLLSLLDHIEAGTQQLTPQSDAEATYAPKIEKSHALINWTQSAIEIDRQIRAFNPWPIAFTYAGETLIRVHQATPSDRPSEGPPGTVMAITKEGLFVATNDQALRIDRLQFAGGKILSATDYVNANRTSICLKEVLK